MCEDLSGFWYIETAWLLLIAGSHEIWQVRLRIIPMSNVHFVVPDHLLFPSSRPSWLIDHRSKVEVRQDMTSMWILDYPVFCICRWGDREVMGSINHVISFASSRESSRVWLKSRLYVSPPFQKEGARNERIQTCWLSSSSTIIALKLLTCRSPLLEFSSQLKRTLIGVISWLVKQMWWIRH
jgi:hypothetical protein